MELSLLYCTNTTWSSLSCIALTQHGAPSLVCTNTTWSSLSCTTLTQHGALSLVLHKHNMELSLLYCTNTTWSSLLYYTNTTWSSLSCATLTQHELSLLYYTNTMLCWCNTRERAPCFVSVVQERELHVVVVQYMRVSSMLC